MTTIAWDGRRIAADTLVSFDNMKSRYTTKIHRIDGALVACAGKVSDVAHFLTWVRAGEHPGLNVPTLDESFEAIVIRPFEKGEAVTYGPELNPEPRPAPWSLGSGAKIAMGALLAGADAKRAVEICIDLDIYSGGDIDVEPTV
jgi:ATP-dependent protease HslVU (ClpYQ) peptidase subunit